MSKQNEALTLALEALKEYALNEGATRAADKAIAAIEAVLPTDYRAVKTYHEGKPVYVSQPEQEPVVCCGDYATCMKSCTPRGRWLAEQEPVAWMCCAFDGKVCEQSNHDECENPIPLYTAPPPKQEARNFCPRCGKRTPDLAAVHTCTPPRGLEMT